MLKFITFADFVARPPRHTGLLIEMEAGQAKMLVFVGAAAADGDDEDVERAEMSEFSRDGVSYVLSLS